MIYLQVLGIMTYIRQSTLVTQRHKQQTDSHNHPSLGRLVAVLTLRVVDALLVMASEVLPTVHADGGVAAHVVQVLDGILALQMLRQE